MKKKLSTVKEELAASSVECNNLRSSCNEIVSQTQQEVYVNVKLKIVLTSLALVCAQMCSAVQGKLENSF